MAIVLCDIDGTLLIKLASEQPGQQTPKRRAINQALAEEFSLPGVDFRQGIEHGLTDWRIAENAVRCHRPGATIDGSTWQRICARAEARFERHVPGHDPHYAPLPGVPATLLAMREAGHVLGLVTGNVSFFGLDKLAHVGLDRGLFTGPCGFGDHGRERRDIVRLAAARAPAGEPLIVLGDTRNDLIGAQEAGLPFLGVGTTGLQASDLAAAPRARWLGDLASPPAVLSAIDELVG
jgi:phosphoglycolate phosphatase-like HAD superfamily hydrolase